MSRITNYQDLITSEFQHQPNYMATVAVDISVQSRVQDLLTSMGPLFDLDLAVGDQLDIIGQWVGISRNVKEPIPGSNVYFSWDADYTLGWDYGTWQPSDLPTEVTVLPDDSYKTIIRGKIAANSWDGTTDGAYAIWDAVFPSIKILIQDNQDMSYDLAIYGGIIDTLTLALLTGGYIPLKPEGVRVNEYLVPINDGPLFGWDVDSTYLSGWDDGSWTREINPT